MTILNFLTKYAQKIISGRKKWKSKHHYRILHIELVKVSNFSVNWQFWFFGPNLLKKSIWSKSEKSEQLMNCAYFKLLVPNFSFKDKICPKRIVPMKNRKIEQHHKILHIQISLGTKFQLKLIILIFWNKFAQKGISYLNQKKMNTPIKFCIFKSVWIPNFSLNLQFIFFDQICPTKYFQLKTEKTDITNELCIFESVLVTNFS